MSGTLSAILPAAITAIATGLAVNPVLRGLTEPARSDGARTGSAPSDPGPEGNLPGDGKIPYAALAGRRFALGCGSVSFALGFTAWALLPPVLQAPWTVLATLGVVLALIDLRTTWLPKRLCQLGWLLMATALALTVLLTGDGWFFVRGLSGALAAGAVYWIVWRVSRRGFGFGDVRYAPLIGAAAGMESWPLWGWALLLGTFVGAGVALVRLIRGRRGPFPYAPSILMGSYLALAVWATA